MNANFDLYSQYYDLLYQDKDYQGEVDYVLSLLRAHGKNPVTTLLELGSGTGMHADLMAAAGIQVHGVELSDAMLGLAKKRASKNADRLHFVQGDARTFRAARKFDAVVSLFHVLSYQTRDNDLAAMLSTAAEHLEGEGLFVFDFWYGPAVLWQRPGLRVKRWENPAVSIARIAEPVLHDTNNTVDVNYTIFATEKRSGDIEQIRETHCMRYLFLNEIDRLLAGAGFSRVRVEEWMTGVEPSIDTWGVCVVARKDGN